jgi:hypothetical protein
MENAIEIKEENIIEVINSKYLKQVKKARLEIKNDRKNFWNKNSVNFRNNIKNLISFFEFPKDWGVSIIASRFLLDRHTMPYDPDVWSFSDVVQATKKQGFDIVIFFNKTDLEYLSAPALLPLVVHEVRHVYQATEDTIKYVKQTVDDDLSKKYEEDADAEIKKYSEEFRKENVLEKVMYCYDEEGWKGAKKMVEYLYEQEETLSKGYDREMTKEEYEAFEKAKEEKDIDLFIDYFIDSLKEEKEKEEKKEDKEDKENK